MPNVQTPPVRPSLCDALRRIEEAQQPVHAGVESRPLPETVGTVETVVVYGIHRRNDLRLVFDDPRHPIVENLLSPGDRVLEYQSAAHLLSDVQSLADTPGGIMYVVFAYKKQSPPIWKWARDIDTRNTEDVFAAAKAHAVNAVKGGN